ncbi:MAG: mycothiol synthase [Actinobacteria bacterium]|uniref:Unannotated protein n=1 Tax=freshwater metagenome TaxID=449393 RepID=A0A6J7BUK2_9ZZZZ|nr:mycothiol synthase [Actinomycetota bacterium]
MLRVRTAGRLSLDERQEVLDFLSEAQAMDDSRLSDHLLLDLTQGPRPGFVGALGYHDDALVGYAQASTGNEGYVIDGIADTLRCADPAGNRSELLIALVAQLPPDAAITWWARPDAAAASTAEHLRMKADRQLLHMQRALPITEAATVALRSFEVGRDEQAWLTVNNAAFAAHGEQGGWDLAALEQRIREPWFDPDGFLLHERDERLAAFCWTKMHPGAAHDGGLAGEIYVIAVHPDFHGLGLGRALTVAGLQHMQRNGAEMAMLYVDATNTSAVRLYESLGFTVMRTEQSYRRPGAPQ